MKYWLFLTLAILSELAGTTSLKASQGFTRLWPSLGVIAGYGLAFYFLSLALRTLPVSVAYAIWSGVGTAGMALIGLWAFGEHLNWAGVLGIVLIILGVVILQLSGAGAH